MGRWTLLLGMLLLAGCATPASESNAGDPVPAELDEPAFAPPPALSEPTIEMGRARVGQAVTLTAIAADAAAPVDYVWHIIGTAAEGDTVLTGESVSYTPLTPTDHAVTLEVRDAYDRSATAEATMTVAIA